MDLGFAVTQHCNLRCPHCIRDDVVTVQSLEVEFVTSVVRQALDLFGDVGVSLTGGEPLLHPDFEGLVGGLADLGVSYRFVTNGWHLRRAMPALDRHPPSFVRLSLSGATEKSHDEERGRGSFRKVLLAAALLTSRRIPTSLSMIVDRRTRDEIEEGVRLAEDLGAADIHFILPQPVPASAARGSDLEPTEWLPVRRQVEALAREPDRSTRVVLDYGAPSDGPEARCGTKKLERASIDAWGRLVKCCQLSDYGENESEVVADLNETSLAEAWKVYRARMEELERISAPRDGEFLDRFPCMRCARVSGKLDWLRRYPSSPWRRMVGEPGGRSLPVVPSAPPVPRGARGAPGAV